MPALLPTMPFAELDFLRRQLDQAYERWFDGDGRAWTPAIDVECDDKALTVRADVPGVDPEEIKVRIPLPSEHKNEPVTITPTAA